MLHAADLTQPLANQYVRCGICEHFCALAPGAWGKCGVRTNRDGILYLTVYGDAIAAHSDPIEKKPLFHFLPGSHALSVGTYGCNFHCEWCQNWEMSQTRQATLSHTGRAQPLLPEAIVAQAMQQRCASIAYTYNEPTVFFEYTYDTAQRARAQGIKNVYVSNGFMSQATLGKLAPYLDGINVDLKGFTPEFYTRYTGGRLEPVKRNIAFIAQHTSIWIEVTTLLIPGLNDAETELRAMAEWLVSVNPAMPWHISAFHPDYQMRDRPRTSPAVLERAYAIGKAAGLQFIYLGNVFTATYENTLCPVCGTLLIP